MRSSRSRPTKRGLAEQPPRALHRLPFADLLVPAFALLHLEARAQQADGDVDGDRRGARPRLLDALTRSARSLRAGGPSRQPLDGAIDGRPDRGSPGSLIPVASEIGTPSCTPRSASAHRAACAA
ncbi:MAG: hypothetical protein U0359_21265 [Byssovorax sp.]